MDLIVSASTTAPSSIRHYMEMLASLDNVPRKAKQFRNFTANSLNLRGKQANDTVDSMWNYLSDLREKEQEAKKEKEEAQKKQMEQDEDQNRERPDEPKSLKEAVKSREVAKEVPAEAAGSSEITPKEVKKAMKKALKKAPSRSMKIKELRHTVRLSLGCGESERKRLKKMIGDQIKVDSDRIKVDGKLVTLR